MNLVKNRKIILSALALGCFGFLLAVVNSFTSDSEFWSISEAHGLFHKGSLLDLSGLIHRPLFLILLRIPSLFSLTNQEHVQLAKAIFGINGWFILYWSYRILQKHFEQKMAIILLVFLLANEVFFFQLYRIRGDLLAAQICLFLWYYLIRTENRLSLKTFLILFVGSFLAFGASLKALYLLLLVSGTVLATETRANSLERLSLFLAPFVGPSVAVILASQFFPQIVEGQISYAFSLWSDNPLLDLGSWRYYLTFLSHDPIGMILFFGAFFWGFFRRRFAASMFFVFAIIIILFQPHKTSFFGAALWPFLCIFCLIEFKSKLTARTSVFSVLAVLGWSIFNFSEGQWYFSGREQLKRIADVEALISELKIKSYMDGISILPRFEPYRLQVDPFDLDSQERAAEILKESPPDLILMTPRLVILEPALSYNLSCCFKPIGKGLYLRKEFPRFPTFQEGRENIEIFGFEPIP